MALDKSKENTRIANYLAMSEEDLRLLCIKGIDNPMILKQFFAEGSAAESDGESENESEETNSVFLWRYAVAAGLIDWDDAKWIEIEGGNHAFFGSYGEQAGDGIATITRQSQ